MFWERAGKVPCVVSSKEVVADKIIGHGEAKADVTIHPQETLTSMPGALPATHAPVNRYN